MRHSLPIAAGLCAAAFFLSGVARADDILQIMGSPTLDPPTVTALGVSLLVSNDDNHNATVTVRYRKMGAAGWSQGLPLHRVRPDVVTGFSVADQFAGSIFDLAPATAYEIELHAVDADGSVDQTLMVTGSTRPVPGDPSAPNMKSATDAASLSAALSGAQAGDVIVLQNGTYQGVFSINASGTAGNPIVIRGETADGVILDGGGNSGNVLEVYGSFVHIERLTIRNANRALRFQGAGAEGNVVRRVHVENTTLGIGSRVDQKDFYICDNILDGPLVWPHVYTDDNGAHSNDDGVHVEGTGHVVCHNRLRGWGDAVKTGQDGARSIDFYGNEILSAYDNGVELDGSARNVRSLRNRFTNTYATISFQPVFGGPAYAIRNVVVNVTHEQLKLHGLGTQPPQEPSGIYILHNTFVSPAHALNLQTSAATHHFVFQNNLFIGPDAPDGGRTVDWSGPIDDGLFDYNGYYPEGVFSFNFVGTGYQNFPSFAAAQSGGVEPNGLLVGQMNFESGLVPPPDYTSELPAADVRLLASSLAVDRGVLLANVNDGFAGNAPDLGAIELGCDPPIYGPRPDGVDETNQVHCGTGSTTGGSGAGGGASGSGSGMTGNGAGGSGTASAGAGGAGANGAGPGSQDSGGCGCRAAGNGASVSGAVLGVLAVLGVGLRRRRRQQTLAGRC